MRAGRRWAGWASTGRPAYSAALANPQSRTLDAAAEQRVVHSAAGLFAGLREEGAGEVRRRDLERLARADAAERENGREGEPQAKQREASCCRAC